MSNAWISFVGLSLDIIGVLLLWRFGIPPDIRRDGADVIVTGNTNEEEKNKGRLYDLVAHGALALIVLGFLLQAVGTGALDSAFSQNRSAPQMSPGGTAPPSKASAPAPVPKP